MKLCLGTVQLGLRYGIQGNQKPDYQKAIKILYSAYYNGITTFDTAAIYGNAELILGNFLRRYGIPSDKVKIVSKLSPKAFDNQINKTYEEIIVKGVESTLKRLGVEHIDGYMFHGADYAFNRDSYDAMQEIKNKGYVGKVGVSVYTPKEAIEAINYGYDLIQIPYNVLDKRFDKSNVFAMAKNNKIKIFARSALLQGLLLMKPEKIPKHMEFSKKIVSEFQEVCRSYSVDSFTAAIQFVCGKEEIDNIVFGVDNLEQLNDYVNLTETRNEKLLLTLNQMWQKVDERILMPNLWCK